MYAVFLRAAPWCLFFISIFCAFTHKEKSIQFATALIVHLMKDILDLFTVNFSSFTSYAYMYYLHLKELNLYGRHWLRCMLFSHGFLWAIFLNHHWFVQCSSMVHVQFDQLICDLSSFVFGVKILEIFIQDLNYCLNMFYLFACISWKHF